MKKVTIFLLISFMIMSLSGCSMVKSYVPREAEDLLFTYIDKSGNLKLRALGDSKDKTILDGEELEEYDINSGGTRIAYVKPIKDKEKKAFIIYNMDLEEIKTIHEGLGACGVEWSPDGRYLLSDTGTGVYRNIYLYDVNTDKLSPEVTIIGYMWAPQENRLCIGIPEQIGLDDKNKAGTISVGLIRPEENFEIQKLLEGTKEYFIIPVKWVDNDNLLLQRVYFDGERPQEPYIMNVESGKLDALSVEEWEDIDRDQKLPEQIEKAVHHISSNGEYVIYSAFDNSKVSQEILLYKVNEGITEVICEGNNPKWFNGEANR